VTGEQVAAAGIPRNRLARARPSGRAPAWTLALALGSGAAIAAAAATSPTAAAAPPPITPAGLDRSSVVPVVSIARPWSRPASAGAATAILMDLGSSVEASLVDARSTLGPLTLMQGAERVVAIALPPGRTVVMSAAGPHLQLRPQQALHVGDRVPLTLVIRDATGRRQEIAMQAEVRVRSALDDERRAHGHGGTTPPH